jgi:hypothetical protein
MDVAPELDRGLHGGTGAGLRPAPGALTG